jgi:hypothetical protein
MPSLEVSNLQMNNTNQLGSPSNIIAMQCDFVYAVKIVLEKATIRTETYK